MPSFLNPYRDCRKTGPITHVSLILPVEEYHRIKRIRLTEGTAQTTLAILWKKLIHECDRLNITSYADQRRFEDFVARCSLSWSCSDIEHDARGGSNVSSGDGTTPLGVDGQAPLTTVGGGVERSGVGVEDKEGGSTDSSGGNSRKTRRPRGTRIPRKAKTA